MPTLKLGLNDKVQLQQAGARNVEHSIDLDDATLGAVIADAALASALGGKPERADGDHGQPLRLAQPDAAARLRNESGLMISTANGFVFAFGLRRGDLNTIVAPQVVRRRPDSYVSSHDVWLRAFARTRVAVGGVHDP